MSGDKSTPRPEVEIRVSEDHNLTGKTIGHKWISLVLLFAMLVNAAVVLIALPEVKSRLALTYSMDFGDLYDLIAKNIDQGNGYRVEPTTGYTMLREPGYPFLLALVFRVAGYGIQQARFVCVLLACGAALLLLRLAYKITSDLRLAVVATLLFLLYPGIVVAEARAGIEIPSIFTVLIFMLVLHSAIETGDIWRYWAAGLSLGLAVLVRSEVLMFPAVLLCYLLLTAKDWTARRKAVGATAVLGFGALMVISPWIIRNYSLVHEVVPTATVTGVAAQEGLYTCESPATSEQFALEQRKAGMERAQLATSLGLPFTGTYYQLFNTPRDEVAFNHALLNQVSTKYREDPLLLVSCGGKNLLFNFWFLGKRRQSTLLNIILQAPLLVLAIIGVVALWKQRLLVGAGVVLGYILYIPMVHAPIIAHARHSMLIVPFLLILAAAALVWGWRELVNKSGDQSNPVLAAGSGR